MSNRDKAQNKKEFALFAAGCFWGVQAVFDAVEGIIRTTAGYSGGEKPNPTYEEVCSGETGHAECVLVEFDPEKTDYERLLDIFWLNHNPTSLNKQGPDVGEQYRSAIFYFNEEQRKIAERSRQKAQEMFDKPIVTEILKADVFYPAEEYHQKYYLTHKISCHVNLPNKR